MPLREIKAGEDSLKNWREINALRLVVLDMQKRIAILEAANRRFQNVGSDGFRWAAAGLDYNHLKDYARNECVIVRPTNIAVTGGLFSAEPDYEESEDPIFAVPGLIWVCLRNITPPDLE